MSLHLHGLGHFHPDNEISNAFLEALDIDTNEAWIVERVGIRSRRTSLPLDYIRTTKNVDPAAAIEAAEYSIAQMGARAARQALARAGVDASAVGMVIAGSCAPDTPTPAEACNIAGLLGLEVPCFDLNSACTSFFAGVRFLAMMQPELMPDYVLLVSSDAMTRTVDYRDRSTAVLFGDCAVAALLSTKHEGRAEILASNLSSSPASADKVAIPRLGHFRQQGREVQMFGIRTGSAMVRELQAQADPKRRFHFVGHQANLRMLEAVAKRAAIPGERHHYNVDRYGNTGSAGAPSVLSMRWSEWAAEDEVAVIGVGAGLTWSSFLLRFSA